MVDLQRHIRTVTFHQILLLGGPPKGVFDEAACANGAQPNIRLAVDQQSVHHGHEVVRPCVKRRRAPLVIQQYEHVDRGYAWSRHGVVRVGTRQTLVDIPDAVVVAVGENVHISDTFVVLRNGPERETLVFASPSTPDHPFAVASFFDQFDRYDVMLFRVPSRGGEESLQLNKMAVGRYATDVGIAIRAGSPIRRSLTIECFELQQHLAALGRP